MATHLTDYKVPKGLKERWKEFGSEVRKCWDKAHRVVPKDAPTMDLFHAYWSCMRESAYHNITYEEAKKAGIEPHPIAVMAYRAKGLSKEEAEKKALKEGKFHGISALRAKMEGLI